MTDNNLYERLLGLSADNTNPEWEVFVKTYIQSSNCLFDKNTFKLCEPNTYIENAFVELQKSKANDTDEKQNPFKKLENGYLCLHRYAINLCGQDRSGAFDIEIARLIKVN